MYVRKYMYMDMDAYLSTYIFAHVYVRAYTCVNMYTDMYFSYTLGNRHSRSCFVTRDDGNVTS